MFLVLNLVHATKAHFFGFQSTDKNTHPWCHSSQLHLSSPPKNSTTNAHSVHEWLHSLNMPNGTLPERAGFSKVT